MRGPRRRARPGARRRGRAYADGRDRSGRDGSRSPRAQRRRDVPVRPAARRADRRPAHCHAWVPPRPSRTRNVVVLPAPLGPRNPVIVPGSRANDRSSTAVTVPKRLVNDSHTTTGATVISVRSWATRLHLQTYPTVGIVRAVAGRRAPRRRPGRASSDMAARGINPDPRAAPGPLSTSIRRERSDRGATPRGHRPEVPVARRTHSHRYRPPRAAPGLGFIAAQRVGHRPDRCPAPDGVPDDAALPEALRAAGRSPTRYPPWRPWRCRPAPRRC